jgi:hypothetical protein
MRLKGDGDDEGWLDFHMLPNARLLRTLTWFVTCSGRSYFVPGRFYTTYVHTPQRVLLS